VRLSRAHASPPVAAWIRTSDHAWILALEEGIPITNPSFYASEERCPDSLIKHVFRVAPQAKEDIPLLPERIAIMREVGAILCAVSVGFHTYLPAILPS